MSDEHLEEALRLAGARLSRRPLRPALRARLVSVSAPNAGLRAARSMVVALVIANVLIAGVAVLGGVGRSSGSARPAVVPPAAAASTSRSTSATALDQALIEGRRIIVDAWLEEVSSCHMGTATALPPDPQACRNGGVLMGQAASGFAVRLRALPATEAGRSDVADLLTTLGDLRHWADRLVADLDRRAPAAVVDDTGWVSALAWSADIALVFGPPESYAVTSTPSVLAVGDVSTVRRSGDVRSR